MGVPTERVNHSFTQFKDEYFPAWRALIHSNPIAAELLMFFIEHMGKQNNAVVVSYATMMEITGRSRATITRAIKSLKDGNWIEAMQIGTTYAYAVNERVAWRTHANQRQYAMFSATVVAGASEQKEIRKSQLKHIPHIDPGAH